MNRIMILFIMFFSNELNAVSFQVIGNESSRMKATVVETFKNPWAMTFINSRKILITTKLGDLWLLNIDGGKKKILGLPKIAIGGQGGLGDVAIHPNFKKNSLVYITLVESQNEGQTRGAAVYRGKLSLFENPKIENLELIWRQHPHQATKGHFSHKIIFGPRNTVHSNKLFISSGDRQNRSLVLFWNTSLGKIVRLNDDGSTPKDNPFKTYGGLAQTFWTKGHRNILGVAFSSSGELWATEMGPLHGDELNLIKKGANYGWPIVSNGDNYSGLPIPDHNTRPEFEAPKITWIPSVAPSGLIFYSGKEFSEWQGDLFLGGLKGKALLRITIDEETATEAERFKWGKRIREVEQGPEGKIWVLEDGTEGRLIKLSK